MMNHLLIRSLILVFFTSITFLSCEPKEETNINTDWPEISHETKPWTRWWWQGSSVTKQGITSELEALKKAGIGGVEITPIYGVIGEEDQFIDFLSDEWVDMLVHTLEEAERLELGVDMATGTGWPFGGPWVEKKYSSKNVKHKTYSVKGGESLSEPIRYIQEPLFRSINNPVYQEFKGKSSEERVSLDQIAEPISANEDLQGLAIEQVRFETELPLLTLMAYSDSGNKIDLTDQVASDGSLDWTAPEGEWKLYAVFQGWHGKMVERAAPGGEGYVIDHFSREALDDYLAKFDSAFSNRDISSLRAFFNDSYEVDDASGEADWTSGLFEEFEKRRGYDLRQFLPALFGEDDEEKNARVLTDYRETIAELLYEDFTLAWQEWAKEKGAIIRNQAHGSPANILDLYAAIDIPETEGEDILKIKFTSSAANVTGKKLSSSESATWLGEHFESNLADVKLNLDRYLLGGVNHVFYHGTSYSPDDDKWPGWLFYAAIHANDRNPLWDDFSTLNQYISRIQSFMQEGKPDNDVLLYFPIFDRYAQRGNSLITHFDPRDEYFHIEMQNTGNFLWENGYAFDFISDKQIAQLASKEGKLLSGSQEYKTIIIPKTEYIPLETFQKLVDLADQGAKIIFLQDLPGKIPGMTNLEVRQKKFEELKSSLTSEGENAVFKGDDINQLLSEANVQKESLVDLGLEYIRKSHERGYYYFISNWSEEKVDEMVPLNVNSKSVMIFDPMSGMKGLANSQSTEEETEVYLQLNPGETVLLATYNSTIEGEPFLYFEKTGESIPVSGRWVVEFEKGGPELPETQEIKELTSWTDFAGEAGKNFSGTASYQITFDLEQNADYWKLDLGEVDESARVIINGKEVDVLTGPNFELVVSDSLLEESNQLEIKVTNLMANRIAHMDRKGEKWKKFYNVNFPARRRENVKDGIFSAESWEPKSSGLLGPVTLTPMKVVK